MWRSFPEQETHLQIKLTIVKVSFFSCKNLTIEHRGFCASFALWNSASATVGVEVLELEGDAEGVDVDGSSLLCSFE
jgi:hypothetical protein